LSITCDATFRYGVTGFPTLKFFPKGNKAGEDYDGGRDLGDFVKFINEKSGTSRDTKGQLTSEVCDIQYWMAAHSGKMLTLATLCLLFVRLAA